MPVNLYTYAQAAEQLGVTKQKVIYALSKLDKDSQLTQKIDNIRYISEDTVNKLKDLINSKTDSSTAKNRKTTDSSSAEVKELRKQLNQYQTMIQDLMDAQKRLIETNERLSRSIESVTESVHLLEKKNLLLEESVKGITTTYTEPEPIHDIEESSNKPKWAFWRRK